MLTIPVREKIELLKDGYRQLSVLPLADGLQLGSEVKYGDDTYARIASMTQLSEHFRCGFDEVEGYADAAMTPEGYLFIKEKEE